jgi:NADH:ubiquinone oxidoreductase subunit 4 (subunit M)
MILQLLFFPLLAAVLVLAAGNKWASKIALGAACVELILTCLAYNEMMSTSEKSLLFFAPWIETPKISFHLAIDGLSMLMVALTNVLP